MPYVDLVSSDDYAAIWYSTNAPASTVGGFDPDKPTVVMFHSLFLDSTFLYPQLDDVRLSANFNIIAVDTRSTGKSLYRPSGRYDLWVAAADLAHLFHHLRLPPAHIFAPEIYGWVALRFAALFPEHVLSVSICNVSPQTELKIVFEAFEELGQLWCFAEDLESFEAACKELISYYAMDCSTDMEDELVAFWEIHYPPFRRSRVITNINLMLNRTPMLPDELASVQCPVLIIQASGAERSTTHPLEYARKLQDLLINVPNGATIFTVKAAHGYLCLLASSIVNQVLNKFLSRLPHAPSQPVSNGMPFADRMKFALQQLAEFRNDPSIAERDPLSPLSFSMTSEEVRRSQEETYGNYAKEQMKALSPLAPDGRPLRKFSERKDDHWLDSGEDGFSYSNIKTLADRPEGKKDKRVRKTPSSTAFTPHAFEKEGLPPSEPASQELQAISRFRRATMMPHGITDKHVLKGSMAKVLASSGGGNISRKLLR